MNRRSCDNRHTVCKVQTEYILKTPINDIGIDFIESYIILLTINNSHYCLTRYNNETSQILIINALLKISSKYIFPTQSMITLISQIDQLNLENMIQNFQKLDKTYCERLFNEKNGKTLYGSITHFFGALNNTKVKLLEYVIDNISYESFINNISICRHIPQEYDVAIIKFINKMIELKELKINKNLIDFLILKPNILEKFYEKIIVNSDANFKKDVLDKTISLLDKKLLIKILNNNNDNKIEIDDYTIKNLISKSYIRENIGASNNKLIAEIIDILIEYNLKVNNNLVKILLEKGCYINNLEKHGIIIDNDILEKCAEFSYYPYQFDFTPSNKIMIIECSKVGNLEKVKELKEKGGILDIECLKQACNLKKNGKVIKYLINQCKLKPNDECLSCFQEINYIEAFDTLLKSYCDNLLTIKNDKDDKDDKNIENNGNNLILNDSILTSITPKDIIINTELEYELKTKIKKLLNYKKKTIKYNELNKIMIKYLIDNKLIIGLYFIINEELSLIIKLIKGTIFHIDELQNMLPYFIDNI
jgi:hypothetical protein